MATLLNEIRNLRIKSNTERGNPLAIAASNPGHAGRPGQRGGSAPGKGGGQRTPGGLWLDPDKPSPFESKPAVAKPSTSGPKGHVFKVDDVMMPTTKPAAPKGHVFKVDDVMMPTKGVRPSSSNDAASKQYKVHSQGARDLLKRISSKLDDYDKQQAAHPGDWGYAGSMGAHREGLAHALANLGDPSGLKELGVKY